MNNFRCDIVDILYYNFCIVHLNDLCLYYKMLSTPTNLFFVNSTKNGKNRRKNALLINIKVLLTRIFHMHTCMYLCIQKLLDVLMWKDQKHIGCRMQVAGYALHLNCLVHGSAMQRTINTSNQISSNKLKSRPTIIILHCVIVHKMEDKL